MRPRLPPTAPALALASSLLLTAAAAQVPAQDAAPPALDPSQLRETVPRTPEPPEASREQAVQRLRAAAARPATARDASWLLGLLALHGAGMPQDAAQAQAWFLRAQQLGHPLAPAGLAWCAIDGCAGAPQPAVGRRWLTALRQVDPGRALYLEWLLESRLAPMRLASPDLRSPAIAPAPRHDLLQRAAREGNVQAQTELGIESAAAGRFAEAAELFRRPALRSAAAAANAALVQERMQPRGNETPGLSQLSQLSQAEQWFQQARRYHLGIGVPSNYTEAIRLYQMAASQGNARARRMLGLIFSRPAPGGGVDIVWMRELAQMEVPDSGQAVLLAPSASSWQRDPTPLYDLVPPEWRRPAGPKPR
jgi:TPR repeat protein